MSWSAEVFVEIKTWCDVIEHGLAWVFESGYVRLYLLGVQRAEARLRGRFAK